MKLRSRFSKGDVVVITICLFWAILCAGSVGGRGASFAKRAVCLANMKRLTVAWLGWVQDNEGAVPLGGGIRLPMSWSPDVEGTALWPYCQDRNVYRCPNGLRGEVVTYCVVESMAGDTPAWTNGPCVSKLSDIPESARATRMVFIDEGRACPDSFHVWYDRPNWWDGPPMRHARGTCVSFADGHSEYWRWDNPSQDLIRLQKAVWGELGYMP
jgi:hypothetical protein